MAPIPEIIVFSHVKFRSDQFITEPTHGFSDLRWTAIGLPIGISFYTFQSLSYCVDVHQGVSPPLKKPTDFLLYIIMFPQLIAGPIVRFNTISEQLTNRTFAGSGRILGFYRFTIGPAKKVLIANAMVIIISAILMATEATLPKFPFGFENILE